MTDAESCRRQEALAERFLRYTAICSQSDASATVVPSTPGQRVFAELLADELRTAGAADVHLSETAVLTARIPARLAAGHPPVPTVGFCVHLDTADAGLSPEVHARVVTYEGGDLFLDKESDAWIRVAEHPELARYAGQRLLVADGSSVLGADDKAGVASVMEAVTGLLADPDAVHGDVCLAVVPDEEIGLRGVRTLDLERFRWTSPGRWTAAKWARWSGRPSTPPPSGCTCRELLRIRCPRRGCWSIRCWFCTIWWPSWIGRRRRSTPREPRVSSG